MQDATRGPKEAHSTVLSLEEETICLSFRKHTLLSLDDCLYALQSSIPKLTRSFLQPLFMRQCISHLPEVKNRKREKKQFKDYLIGYFHIDIAKVKTEGGNKSYACQIDLYRFFRTKILNKEKIIWIKLYFLPLMRILIKKH
ncbi:MAG: Integrase, catalytic core [Francisellaceae bacterium]|nr:Integrase, catalytic core [Francisellaceae bacterium]